MTDAYRDFSQRLEYSGTDRLIHSADLVLVAFSGGADSSLLLHLLNKYLCGSGTKLAAAHLNHMIRGDEALRDESFSAETAKKLGIEMYVKRVDIPSLAEKGGSVEEIARRERYAFFSEIAEKLGGRVLVATAHNADDNLETVLFNLIRGSGTSGMCGIPHVRDGMFIRPLITYSSDEIRSLCAKLGVDYVVDSTNLSTDYTRNKLRHLVIPHLKEINPAAHKAVLRMTASIKEDDSYLEELAEGFLSDVGENTVKRERLEKLHNAVLSRVIRKMYSSFACGTLHSIENIHIREIISHLRSASEPFCISVPGDGAFCFDGTECFFVKNGEGKEADSTPQLLEPEKPLVKNGYIILLTQDKPNKKYPSYENIYNLSIHTAIKFDKIKSKLEVRTRRAGDSYRFGGMTRKLKKLFCDKKLTEHERDRIPIVCDSEGILWIPSFPLRDGMKPENDADCAYILCFKEKDLEILGVSAEDILPKNNNTNLNGD